MALSSTVLAGEIETALESYFGTPEDPTRFQQFCLQLATAIVGHIQSNAVVTVTGVMSGSSSATGTVQ